MNIPCTFEDWWLIISVNGRNDYEEEHEFR